MSASKIEWTEATWNPVTGCTKISRGCAHCYAERMAKRLQAMGQPNYVNGFEVATHSHVLSAPLEWKKPQIIFTNSMSDTFHENVEESFIKSIYTSMAKANWHIFQVLTKRSSRALALAPDLEWPSHIWMGVTVEDSDHIDRIDHLRRIPASVRFISMEPLLGPVPDLDLSGIDWVIVGGESGPGARPMQKEWVVDILNQCHQSGARFFFKQWGGVNKKKTGRILNGRIYNEMPEWHNQMRCCA